MADTYQFETIPFLGEAEGEWTPEIEGEEEGEIARRGGFRPPSRARPFVRPQGRFQARPRAFRPPQAKPRLLRRRWAPGLAPRPNPPFPPRPRSPRWLPYPAPVATFVERPAAPFAGGAPGPAQGGEAPSELARWTQSCLNRALGLSLPVTGLLDPATRDAVRRFQEREGLPVDGIMGPPTQTALGAACTRGPGGKPAAPPPAEASKPAPAEGDASASAPAADAPPEEGELPRRGGCGCRKCREKAMAEEFAFVGEGELLEGEFLEGEAFEAMPLGETFEFEMNEGELLEAEAWQDEAPRPGAPRPGAAKPCALLPAECPPPGRPVLVLDRFRFDSGALDPARHGPPVKALAARILASQRSTRPIRSLTIVGHTDRVGDDRYNVALARRRAQAVAQALCAAMEAGRRGATRGFSVRLASCGERQVKRTPELSRRVEIFLPTPGSGRRNAPDTANCGVPRGGVRRELELEGELLGEVRAPPRRPGASQSVAPALSFFQNASEPSHRNHFSHQAGRWAGRIRAHASPTGANCAKRVGATAYGTGADIIRTIQAAQACQGRRIEAIHVFSHSGSHGVFGSRPGAALGLYRDSVDPASRAQGARVVGDIPTGALADNVAVVLHGCNTAAGPDSVAAALFRHLAARLRDPRVFGHPNSGCAGRDDSWREFSRAAPNGRAVASIAPIYQGKGGCP